MSYVPSGDIARDSLDLDFLGCQSAPFFCPNCAKEQLFWYDLNLDTLQCHHCGYDLIN